MELFVEKSGVHIEEIHDVNGGEVDAYKYMSVRIN